MREIFYRLPVNLEFIAIALHNESTDIIYYINLSDLGWLALPFKPALSG